MELVKTGYIGGSYTEVFEFEERQFRFPFGSKPAEGVPTGWIDDQHLSWSDESVVEVALDVTLYKKNPVENYETGAFNRI